MRKKYKTNFMRTVMLLLACVLNFATAWAQEYEITFRNYDNAVLQSGKWACGQIPKYDGTPTRQATQQYSYIFKGWYPEAKPLTPHNSTRQKTQ